MSGREAGATDAAGERDQTRASLSWWLGAVLCGLRGQVNVEDEPRVGIRRFRPCIIINAG